MNMKAKPTRTYNAFIPFLLCLILIFIVSRRIETSLPLSVLQIILVRKENDTSEISERQNILVSFLSMLLSAPFQRTNF